ncbi:MAG: hypothetical protein J3K34DRAFT_415543 [Monoraphidium minutum]|nr:MAG: hypothetical protein J3K34DRAFT_415543 [Monoraphidium minutum]
MSQEHPDEQHPAAQQPEQPEAEAAASPLGDEAKPGSSEGGDPEQDSEEGFVNHGLEVWLERRRQWRSEGSSEEALREQEETRKRKRSYVPTVTVEQLLSFHPLPHPVPLEEAVEVLAELWESEEPF